MIIENNILLIANGLCFSNYPFEKILRRYICCKFMNNLYPSETLIRAYLRFFKTDSLR